MDNDSINSGLFEQIASDLAATGYSITTNSLPPDLADSLYQQVQATAEDKFKRAGIGREQDLIVNSAIRSDEVCWIDEATAAGKAWLDWTGSLQAYLNRRLFLGLFSFESHFAHYAPGDFYKRHMDAFTGQANRLLTVVTYLNPNWEQAAGGELVIQISDDEADIIKVTPAMGTLVVFLSEEFPHEVLPANKDRYSIAGWYRVNASSAYHIDPPQ